MCGIAGILSSDPSLVSTDRVRRMTNTIAHRGPDGEAAWISPSGTIALGHRRLAIIDLSEAAAQPMHYYDRYSIVYNGEIYNYKELRDELLHKGYPFYTQSDTEVILAAYKAYGKKCVDYLDGMFAFAIWDEQEQKLFAARDRFGEKPFYFHFNEKEFLFASEMKALWAIGIQKHMNEAMLFNYLTIGYIQDPGNPGKTFYNDIQKLPPRSHLSYDLHTHSFSIEHYWDIYTNDKTDTLSEADTIDQFTSLWKLSVKRRLRSDVPLGTSLSGGLDSSAVLATICNSNDLTGRLKTFSAVFPGYERNEGIWADLVSDQFGVVNYKIQPDENDLLNDFQKICYHQEEPFQSASILAQYKVYQLAASQGVTVLLDGQGADEILAGYSKYYEWYWRELYRTNKTLLNSELKALNNFPVNAQWNWKQKLRAIWPVQADAWLTRQRTKEQKAHPDLDSNFTYAYGFSHYHVPHLPGLNGVLYYNTFLNGLGELLQYADRNSMAHGREVRLPFLFHELVEFIYALPSHYKIKNGYTKWILRKSMEPVLDKNIVWRKDKIGFDPPQMQWMGNPAVQENIQEAKRTLVKNGILKNEVLHKKIQPHDTHAADNFDWRYLVAGTLLR